MTPTDERGRYQPSPIGEASVRNDDGRLTLELAKTSHIHPSRCGRR